MERMVDYFLLILLLFFSGITSAAEIALVSISRVRLRYLIDKKSRPAMLIDRILRRPERLFGTILVSNNLANIWASALATALAISYFGSRGVVIATAAITFLVILGEVSAKTYATKHAEKIALTLGKPVKILIFILAPLVRIFTFLNRLVLKMFGEKDTRVFSPVSAEEIKMMIEVGGKEGIFPPDEKKMLHGVFAFYDTTVKEVMVPRVEITALDISEKPENIRQKIVESGYSRLPVYQGTLDNIIGILYSKDLLRIKNEESTSLTQLLRPVYFVPESKKVKDLLKEFQRQKLHIAIVVDEYGGTEGLVTLEDLLEEIVGEIQDEYDREEAEIEELGESVFLIRAKTSIEKVNRELGLDLPLKDSVETIGGFVVSCLGKIPRLGEKLEHGQSVIEVVEMRGRRLARLKLTKRHPRESNE